MLVYVFSDFQGEKYLPEGNPDLVILLGDIYHAYAKEIDSMYECTKIGVYGNHDMANEWGETSIRLIHESFFEYKGWTFAGFGGSPKYNRRTWNQYTEEECKNFMDNLHRVDVFLAHSNPSYGRSGDLTDAHRGFKAFDEYIERQQPALFLHGHIHESTRREFGKTTIFSVYPCLQLDLQNSN